MASAQLSDAPERTDHPAHPAAPDRLVPALVNGQRIFIEDPSWCSMDHVAENERHLEDLYHGGSFAELKLLREGGELELLMFARLGLDPYSPNPARRVPFVVIDDGQDCADLTPRQAEEFADSLVAFAARIRDLARSAAPSEVA